MLYAKELQVLTGSVLREKKALLDQQEAQKSSKHKRDSDAEFRKVFPRIAQEIEKIARKGWSLCGVEISRDDLQNNSWNPNPEELSGVGLLLFNEFKDKNLNPVLGWGLYDQPPEYSGSLKVLFVIVTWENPGSVELRNTNINDLRHTTPLIHWVLTIERGETRIEYPDER